MPKLKLDQHEVFAREIAKGSLITNAYVKAGYAPHASSASRLLADKKITARVAELQEMAVQKTLVTIERLTDELEDARELAMRDEKGSAAAVSAIMAKAKLHGLDINKHKVEGGINIIISSDDDRL